MDKFLEQLQEMTLQQIEERLAALEVEVRSAQKVEDIDAAAEQKKALLERKAELEVLEARKNAALTLTVEPTKATVLERGVGIMEENTIETRAKEFAQKNSEKLEARSLLLTTTGIAKATKVQQEINDAYGLEPTSLVDFVNSVDVT